MLFATEISVPVILLCVAVPLLLGLAGYNLTRWIIGTVDKAVDDRQEVYGRLASLFSLIGLPEMGAIAQAWSALAVVKTIKLVRQLVDRVMPHGVADLDAVIKLLEGNFFWQLSKRLEVIEQRAKLVKILLDNSDAKAAIIAALNPPAPPAA